ncbi:hypothetical protein A2U01_0000660, partial [Trifolium medium]|nr:hypothetical protein [Trifolium medium]
MSSFSFTHQARPPYSLGVFFLISFNPRDDVRWKSTTKHSFINCAAFLDVETAQEIDQAQGSCVHDVVSSMHTYQMEYDPQGFKS